MFFRKIQSALSLRKKSIDSAKKLCIILVQSEFTYCPVDNIAIQGTVTNNGEITANMVKVVATLYDRDGNVVFKKINRRYRSNRGAGRAAIQEVQ